MNVRWMPLWLYSLLLRKGFGHVCVVDDPTHPDYVGFTAGICYRNGIHRWNYDAPKGTP